MSMLVYPEINPIAVQIGPLAVHWYGLMYLIGFLSAWGLLAWRIKTSPRAFTLDQTTDILFYGALGVILGGRLGSVLFYNFSDTMHHPLQIFEVWKGGMSFHGGLIGVMIALWLYARKNGRTLFEIGDFVVPVVPIGLATGRIGNFINSELWGKVTDVPWAMVFPNGGDLPRHPSQLYEFLLEGFLLFLILWMFSMKERPRYAVSGLFLLCYGIFRFFIEFFRVPDVQIGYIAFGWLTEGQLLSLPMILLGASLLAIAYRCKRTKLCSNI